MDENKPAPGDIARKWPLALHMMPLADDTIGTPLDAETYAQEVHELAVRLSVPVFAQVPLRLGEHSMVMSLLATPDGSLDEIMRSVAKARFDMADSLGIKTQHE